MIAKERDPREHLDTDVFSRAGAAAEEQMAFYLRRAFAADANVAVFNDLRIVDDAGEAAQFDHLVLHRRGIIVIESKSVTSAVRVNDHGEWMREWDGRWQGMPSPILQAKRQIEVLKGLLNAHRQELRDKRVFGMFVVNFNLTPFEVFIAVSDKGRIERDRHTPPEVLKAEAVVDAVKGAIRKHSLGLLSPAMDKGQEKYSDTEFATICNFLAKRHTPLQRASTNVPAKAIEVEATSTQAATFARESAPSGIAHRNAPAATASNPPPLASASKATPVIESKQTCSRCQSTNLVILYGRFGYYWKCKNCGHTCDIDRSCPRCGEKTKTRKEGLQFYRDCSRCASSQCFHTNPEDA